jgi:hypothetical protein
MTELSDSLALQFDRVAVREEFSEFEATARLTVPLPMTSLG